MSRLWLLASVVVCVGCLDFDAFDRCAPQGCSQCIAEVRAGWAHTCARKTDGTIWCWGVNNAEQLGLADLPSSATPSSVDGLSNAVELVAGDSSSCVLVGGGTVQCWGYDSDGQLGDGKISGGMSTPVAVLNVANVESLAAGADHVCAAMFVGSAVCWGKNDAGQIGNGTTTTPQLSPQSVSSLAGVVELAAALSHSCALKSDGSVWCWGENDHGELGDGTTNDRSTATIPVMISNVVHIAAGLNDTCAIKQDGTVWCWGLNNLGQLGDGSTNDASAPVQAGALQNVVELSLAGYQTFGPYGHACAREASGSLWCWGGNNYGELGDGTTTDRSVPVKVAGISNGIELGVGAKHSCAVRGDGTLWCWGANDVGQLGNGSFVESHVPVASQLSCP